MPVTPVINGLLVELFSSIQGEGVLVGARQAFLRLAGCNLDCRYCDTPFAPSATWMAELVPGSGKVVEQPNPAALSDVLRVLEGWGSEQLAIHHSLSLTGGEPLLQGKLLENWLPELKKLLPLYLETNGTMPQALEPLLPHLSFVSMDMKLPSISGTPFPEKEHREFLMLASRSKCQVKLVFAPETPLEELKLAARIVQKTAPDTPLILQPVTRDPSAIWLAGQLLDAQQATARIHANVRLIPQVHRYLQLL